MAVLSNLVENISSSIISNNNFSNHKDILILGENNSGKSYILKNIINKLINNSIYFIDANNRYIPTEINMSTAQFNDLDINEIIKNRVDDKNFNKKDVFGITVNINNEIVISELLYNYEKYKKLFKEVLDIELVVNNIEKIINIKAGDNEESLYEANIERELVEQEEFKILINGEDISKISNGYQAMLRILMEIDFAYNNNKNVIIIDEFDMHLDYINPNSLIENIRTKYKDIRLILCCHSVYTVLESSEFDVIKIIKDFRKVSENKYLLFDSNDLYNIEIIDRKIFRMSQNNKNNIDIKLSNLLNNKIMNGECDNNELKEINKQDLSIRQKVIMKFIEQGGF